MTSSLSRGKLIAGGAAAVLFIDMFLSWYGVDLGGAFGDAAERFGVDTTATAWQAFDWTDLLLLLTVLVTVGWIVGAMTGSLPADRFKPIVMAAGAVMTLIVLYRIINQPGENELINVKYGAFIGLIACAAIAFGAYSDEEADRPLS